VATHGVTDVLCIRVCYRSAGCGKGLCLATWKLSACEALRRFGFVQTTLRTQYHPSLLLLSNLVRKYSSTELNYPWSSDSYQSPLMSLDTATSCIVSIYCTVRTGLACTALFQLTMPATAPENERSLARRGDALATVSSCS